MVKIAQLMIPQPPWGRKKNRYFAIRAAVSEIQLFLTLNGKLALIGYKLGHNYLTEYPIGLKLRRATSGCPRIIFGKVGQSYFFCEI